MMIVFKNSMLVSFIVALFEYKKSSKKCMHEKAIIQMNLVFFPLSYVHSKLKEDLITNLFKSFRILQTFGTFSHQKSYHMRKSDLI